MFVSTPRYNLVAVHLDKKAPEFRRAATFWQNSGNSTGRAYLESNYHPYPFQNREEGLVLCSENGEIRPNALPTTLIEQPVVLVGGVMSDHGCLSRAFYSLVSMGYYSARKVELIIPLDCCYSVDNKEKAEYVRGENKFNKTISGFFPGAVIKLNGKILGEQTASAASLDWLTTADQLTPPSP